MSSKPYWSRTTQTTSSVSSSTLTDQLITMGTPMTVIQNSESMNWAGSRLLWSSQKPEPLELQVYEQLMSDVYDVPCAPASREMKARSLKVGAA